LTIERTAEVPGWVTSHPDLGLHEIWLYTVYALQADDQRRVHLDDEMMDPARERFGQPALDEWTLSLIEAGALLVDADGTLSLASAAEQ
jgi:hypothetical protein